MVWDSYLKIKANKCSAGIDRQTMEDFEKDLRKNLYKIWNRLTSGSYFPQLSAELIYRKEMVKPDHLVYRLFLIG
jgi:retron-type reverse transcriptase